jgi:hypothetical protein
MPAFEYLAKPRHDYHNRLCKVFQKRIKKDNFFKNYYNMSNTFIYFLFLK